MGLIGLVATAGVVGGLSAGILFNIWVTASCDYLQNINRGNSNNNINATSFQFGVWKYAVDSVTSEYDTQGECEDLSDLFAKDEIDWKYRTAQVCSIIAPCGGALALLVVLLSQFCCPVPFGEKLMGLGYSVANVSTSLVWLVKTNSVCDTLLGGCEWGDAAIYQLVAQIAYVLAAIFYRCLPDPKERREERGRAKEQQEHDAAAAAAANQDQKNKNIGDDDGGHAQALQTQLDEANTQIHDLQQENEKTKKALAAATAATTAAGTAAVVELKKVQKEKDALEKQLKNLEIEHEKANKELTAVKSSSTQPAEDATAKGNPAAMEAKIQQLEEDNKKTKRALAVATAATSTAAVAEAAKIQKLKEEMEDLKKELDQRNNELEQASSDASRKQDELEKENEQTKKALAVATAAAGTAAAAEAAEIKRLKDENNDIKQQLLQHTDMEKELKDENEKIKESPAALEAKIQQLEEENQKLKRTLTVATAATSTAAITRVKEENNKIKEQLQQETDMVKELKDENEKIKRGLGAATAATGTAAAAEAIKIKRLQEEIDDLKDERENMSKELEESKTEAEKLRAALTEQAAGTPSSESNRDTVQVETDGIEIVESPSSDPPGYSEGPASSMTLQEVISENLILKAEMDMMKADYAEKVSILEETETSIRLDLASKIDELHEKNEKRKEALEMATNKVSHDNIKMRKLRKEKEALQERIQALEEENAKMTISLVKAQLHPAASSTSPRSGGEE